MLMCKTLEPNEHQYLYQFYGACNEYDESMNCLSCESSGKKRFYNPEGKINYLVHADKYQTVYNYCTDECPPRHVTNNVDFTCDKCASDEYLEDNECKSCSEEHEDACLMCDSETCFKCANEFYVDSDGSCAADSDLVDCDPDEFRDEDGDCISCGDCSSCHLENGDLYCDACRSNYVYSIEDGYCYDVSEFSGDFDYVIVFGPGSITDEGTVISANDFPL